MDTPKQRSPYGLIQEELRDDPWRLLVACIMLNLTNIKQVRQIIWEFFARFPTHASVSENDEAEIAMIIKPLGLYNRRARSIVRLSLAFDDSWQHVDDLPGIGKYAADSYRMFCEGRLDVKPTDAKLVKYLEWAQTLSTDGLDKKKE